MFVSKFALVNTQQCLLALRRKSIGIKLKLFPFLALLVQSSHLLIANQSPCWSILSAKYFMNERAAHQAHQLSTLFVFKCSFSGSKFTYMCVRAREEWLTAQVSKAPTTRCNFGRSCTSICMQSAGENY